MTTENTQNLPENTENETPEVKTEESHVPEIAQKKVTRFGIGQFQNGSKFGK